MIRYRQEQLARALDEQKQSDNFKYKTVRYDELLPYLTDAIKKQQQMIEKQQQDIYELQQTINSLKK